MLREALTSERLFALAPQEAAALFLLRRAEGFTQSEQVFFEAWLAADEAHVHALARADRAWLSFADDESNEILQAMRSHALEPRRVWPKWQRAASAAMILFLIGGVSMWLMPPSGTRAPIYADNAQQSIQYIAAGGQVRDIKLPDGSLMALDAHRAAVGRFTADARSVELVRGRAFFAVVHDRARPFAVTAAGMRVVAVGTRFDVNLAAGALTVTLLQGRITVGAHDAATPPASLEAGQQFVERNGSAIIRTIGAQTESVADWRHGLIDFDDKTLAEAVVEINRDSLDQIIIRDPAVAAIRLSGQFRAGEADRFASAIAEMHRLRVVRRPGGVELVSTQ